MGENPFLVRLMILIDAGKRCGALHKNGWPADALLRNRKQENAAGRSNACAGYVLLKRWAEALAQILDQRGVAPG